MCVALQLSIGVLTTTFVGAWAMTGGSKKPVEKAPPIQASSKDEENFIQYVSVTGRCTSRRECCEAGMIADPTPQRVPEECGSRQGSEALDSSSWSGATQGGGNELCWKWQMYRSSESAAQPTCTYKPQHLLCLCFAVRDVASKHGMRAHKFY
jgi:hypothetical protein